jgi:hypothetical protein
MIKLKKKSLWIIGFIVVLVIVLSTGILLSNRIINQESVRNRIRSEASRAIAGNVEFQRINVSFFPQPHLKIHQFSFSIPETVNGVLASLAVYPKILPLLTGKLRFARIDVTAPDIEILSGKRQESSDTGAQSFSFEAVKEKVGSLLSAVSSKAAGIDMVITGGRLKIMEGKKPGFEIRDLHARIELPTDKLNLDMQCSSSIWEEAALTGSIDIKTFSSNANIKLIRIHPKFLAEHLFPHLPSKVAMRPLDLKIDFKTDGINVLQVAYQGSMPFPTVSQEEKEPTVKIKSFKGDIFRSEAELRVSIDGLKLIYPRLNLSGKLAIQKSPQPAFRKVNLKLKAVDVDVDSTRKIALVRAGDIPVVKDIFDIVKGGRVPSITFTSHGKKISDLGALDNITIKGNMQDGEVWVPEVDLDLHGVKGDVVISKGILYGDNLNARLGNSRASAGTLKLGLEGENAPFHLDLALEADLAQVPLILMRVIDHKVFLKEMAYLKDVKGNASGRLVLGERIDAIKASVDVNQFNVFYDDQRLPHPVIINSGQFSLKGSESFAKNLRGSIGKSTFSGLSIQFAWGELPYFKVKSGKTEIFLEQTYPWLVSSNLITGKLQDIKRVQGEVALSAVSLHGPFLEPGKYRYQITGDVQDLAVTSSMSPEAIVVSKGNFSVTNEKISFADFQARIMDASLTVSGAMENYQNGVSNVDLSFHGKMGSNAMDRVSGVISLPPQIDLKTPVLIADAHLTWRKQQETSFSGHLTLPQGLNIDTDVLSKPKELNIKKLIIKDRASNASIRLGYKGRAFNISFSGDLNKTTLDNLIKENKILKGRINGDFHADMVLDQPGDSTIQGNLHIKDLVLPIKKNSPLAVNTLFLNATGSQLRVESGDLSWVDNRFDLTGNIMTSSEGVNLDLGLKTDMLNLDKLKQTLEEQNKANHVSSGKSGWTYPIRGVLKLKSGKLTFAGFTWDPFQADIAFGDKVVTISVIDANLCGIDTPGIFKVYPQMLEANFKPVSENQELHPVIVCLLDKSVKVDGRFSLDANLSAQGTEKELLRSLTGDLELTAPEGRYYAGRSIRILTKIFGLLNVTELFKGKLPDINTEGFGYNSMRVKADIQNGNLNVHEYVVDGTSMEIVGRGSIDLINKQVDGTVLVAPLKTVDAIVKKIPGINYILGGTLVSIPFRIEGHPDNLNVTPLPASAIGSGLKGIMKRTFQLPIKIIQPVLPGED